MKVFRNDDGRILQLADEEKIKKWDAEMPLIFVGEIKDNSLPQYRKSFSKKLVKEVEDYIDDVLEQIAIPKLIGAISSDDQEKRLRVAENIADLSDNNPDQLKIALPQIEEAIKSESDKNIKSLMEKAVKNYQRAQKRKQTAKKRKELTALRKNMDKIDQDFADGKISDADYVKEQKKYLKLKREIELEEEV